MSFRYQLFIQNSAHVFYNIIVKLVSVPPPNDFIDQYSCSSTGPAPLDPTHKMATAEKAQYNAFLCYVNSDEKVAQAITENLSTRGLKVYQAADDLQPGVDVSEKMKKAEKVKGI